MPASRAKEAETTGPIDRAFRFLRGLVPLSASEYRRNGTAVIRPDFAAGILPALANILFA